MEMQTGLLTEAFQHARSLERIRAAIHACDYVSRSLTAVGDVQPALGPELEAARDHLLECGEALMRAFETSSMLFEVQVQNVRARLDELNTDEEGL